MAIADVDLYRWTREEYEQLAAAGCIHPEARLELIDGLIYHMSPQTSLHSTGVRAAQDAAAGVFAGGYDIRVQMPLALGEDSEPEPDVAVVPGHFTDYTFSHPTTAVLVIEVADRSLLHDRKRKIPLYARAGIPEVWLVVLKQAVIEIYRNPVEGRYQSQTDLRIGDSVSPLNRPEASIPVEGFFPWERAGGAR